MTLKDLMYSFCSDCTYLCTNNDTWPEQYRQNYIYYANLFCDIVNNYDNEYVENIFNSKVSICVKGYIRDLAEKLEHPVLPIAMIEKRFNLGILVYPVLEIFLENEDE